MQKQWIVVLARKKHCFLHSGSNRAPHPLMSIFSLVKGEKEHEVFEFAFVGGWSTVLLVYFYVLGPFFCFVMGSAVFFF